MQFTEIFLILIAIFNFIVAGFIFGRNKNSHINISFSLMYLFAAIWSIGLALFRLSVNEQVGLVYVFSYYISAMLIAPSFVYFSYAFPFSNINLKIKNILKIYSPGIIMSFILLLPDVLVNRINIAQNNTVDLEWAYYLYSFVFICYVIWALFILFNKFRKSDGVNKLQLRIILIAMLIGFSVGMAFNLFLPLAGNYDLIWIGPLSAFLVMIYVYYLITKKN